MAKKVKIIRKIKSKIREIKPSDKHEDEAQELEQEIQEEQDQQFSEFISTGVAPSPTLETGQTQQPLNQVSPTSPSPQAQQATPERLYDTDTTAIAEGQGLGRTYQETPTLTLEKTHKVSQRSASQGSSIGQSDELSALRGRKSAQGEKTYDTSELSGKPSEQRRRAWEGG